jgi:hypothetical protein
LQSIFVLRRAALGTLFTQCLHIGRNRLFFGLIVLERDRLTAAQARAGFFAAIGAE